ncbi:hypothetical protein [Clostridium sp. AN503]|uniref:hypothetical protein n=1 Tax=Clostridium sp. AN503 TaxID=3160598 RepID=UPI00345A19E8
MVKGLELFRDFFQDYKEQYVLIGGAACDIIFEDAAQEFRATRDLDLVLIVEALTPEFGKIFWEFVNTGKYHNKSRSEGTPQFYRFDKPEVPEYPYMLELFSRQSFQLVGDTNVLTPMHIGDEISSLSAILLNDVYYQMILDGRMVIDGMVVLAPVYIVPFKAKAWLDLSEKRKNGLHVDSKDIKKHKNDVVRLVTLLSENEDLILPDEVRIDMEFFIDGYEKEPADLKALGILSMKNEDIISRMRGIYLK